MKEVSLQASKADKKKFILTFILCWVSYSMAYFCRVNWSVSMPFLTENFGWTNLAMGTVASGFFISYAIGQLVNGIVGDRFNPRFFVALGMIGSAACNILISTTSNYNVVFVLWTLNGFFQSMLWGPIIRTLSSVTPERIRVLVGTLMSTSMVAGYLICYKVAGKVAQVSWSKAFLIPGITFAVNAVIWLLFIDVKTEKKAEVKIKERKPQKKAFDQSFIKFMAVNGLIIIAIICVVHGIIKESISTWSPTLVIENYNINSGKALNYISFIPIANLAGIVFAGWLSQRHSENHTKSIGIFFIISMITSFVLSVFIDDNIIVTVACLSIISACMFAINSIALSIIPMGYTDSGRVSSVAGTLDFASYVGSALSGSVIGALTGQGWKIVAIIWAFLSMFAIVITAVEKRLTSTVRE